MNKRLEYFITANHENEAYHKLVSAIKGVDNFSLIVPDTTLILNVSPDYSSMITQRLRHALSLDGEIMDSQDIEVPYPDATDNTWYIERIEKLIDELVANKYYSNFLFVEAGIIRGSNYKMIEDLFLKRFTKEQLLFTALFENVNSKFKSDCVGEYYNNDEQDLTFYWERYNKHWS